MLSYIYNTYVRGDASAIGQLSVIRYFKSYGDTWAVKIAGTSLHDESLTSSLQVEICSTLRPAAYLHTRSLYRTIRVANSTRGCVYQTRG